MDQHNISITPKGLGEVEIKSEVRGNSLGEMALAEFLRSLPADQLPFFKDCRIKSAMPVYLPVGDFEAHETALSLDKDQMDWFYKNHPEFHAQDSTRNNHLSTGSKIIVSVNR